MTKDIGRVAEATGLSQVEPQEGLAPSGFDPSRDVAKVVEELAAQFGPGHSNGVVAILVHPGLPEQFGREEWTDWTFRPAEGAFDWAHNRGLIVPWKLSSKWTFTPLGLAVANYFRRDSDGSPKGGDACGSVHDSAGRNGIAPKVPS